MLSALYRMTFVCLETSELLIREKEKTGREWYVQRWCTTCALIVCKESASMERMFPQSLLSSGIHSQNPSASQDSLQDHPAAPSLSLQVRTPKTCRFPYQSRWARGIPVYLAVPVFVPIHTAIIIIAAARLCRAHEMNRFIANTPKCKYIRELAVNTARYAQ